MEKIKALDSRALAHHCVHNGIVAKLKHSHLEKAMVIAGVFHKIERGQRNLTQAQGAAWSARYFLSWKFAPVFVSHFSRYETLPQQQISSKL